MIRILNEHLVKLLVEESFGYPDNTNKTISRKKQIEKLIHIQNTINHNFWGGNKTIIIKQYCYAPNNYNESDTALGKERFSFLKDDEPFIETIVIRACLKTKNMIE